MRNPRKTATVALFGVLAICSVRAQEKSGDGKSPSPHRAAPRKTLNAKDRQAVLDAALDWRKSRPSGHDCSHLVHSIYTRAGFPYRYADSDDLYAGVQGFRRVSRPQGGDVIVWPGHAGIVVEPAHHTFFSFLSAGPGIDDYRSRYWRGRGRPRYYRYIKNDPCAGCTLARNRTGE
jgi:cell wall-associated NlpC family hydrolase